jgi:hypothetical protein
VRGRNEDRRLRGSRRSERLVLYGSKCCQTTKTRRKQAPLKQKVNRRQVVYIVLCCVSGPPLYTKVYLAFQSFPSHCCITLTRSRSYPYARRSIRLLGLRNATSNLPSKAYPETVGLASNLRLLTLVVSIAAVGARMPPKYLDSNPY